MDPVSHYNPLSRRWAKLEILLGLTAAGVGTLLGNWVTHAEPEHLPWVLGGALVLFVLGGYLALAGHRSHLYQSINEQTQMIHDALRRHDDTILHEEPRTK
jgi:hypothetical protein